MITEMPCQTYVDVLDAARFHFKDDFAIVDRGKRFTYGDLGVEVDRASKAFVAAGVRHGDRIAIWAPNCWQWPVIALGLQTLGAQLVPVNTRYVGDEALFILERVQAKLLFVVSGFLGIDFKALLAGAAGKRDVDGRFAKLPALERVVDLGVQAEAPDSFEKFLEGGTKVSATELSRCRASVAPDDISDILFTSGTTGKPKGVLVTHSQSIGCVREWVEAIGLGRGDRYLVINPFFHVFGYRYGWLGSFLYGATVYPLAAFDPVQVFELIDSERISVLPGPPTIYQSLLSHPKRGDYDLTCLRAGVTGSADVPVDLVARIRSELGFKILCTSYGLTEFSGAATITKADAPPEVVSHSAGRAMAGVEIKIAPMEKSGLDGEILLKGDWVMQGYLDDEAATREAIDNNGWLHTGDIGHLDSAGNLVITGRLKDMILVGGFNVYPAEIESVIEAHAAVKVVAVVGQPDERLGEIPEAWVILVDGSNCEEAEIIAWCRKRLANFKVPRMVRFVKDLPMTPSGKIQKHLLKTQTQNEGVV